MRTHTFHQHGLMLAGLIVVFIGALDGGEQRIPLIALGVGTSALANVIVSVKSVKVELVKIEIEMFGPDTTD